MSLTGIVVLVLVFTVLAGIFFILGLVFMIMSIVQAARKNKVKRPLILFIVFSVLFIGVAIADVYTAWTNRQELFHAAIEEVADYTADALGTTIGNFGKYYDKTIVARVGNMDIGISRAESEIKGKSKVYKMELSIDNKNDPNEKVYMHLLVENHYIVGVDNDGFIYDVIPVEGWRSEADDGVAETEDGANRDEAGVKEGEYSQQYANSSSYDKIPVGKTRHFIEVSIPEEAELAYLRFLDKEVPLN